MSILPKFKHGLALALIVAATFFAYLGSFQGAFQFDDLFYIVQNPAIRDITDVSAIWNAASVPIRFLTFYTFAINYHFHEYHVFGYHVVNYLIHLINCFLLYWLVGLAFKTPQLQSASLAKRAGSIAFWAALFFGVHPLGTQAVTYICQRFASLATLFYILSVCLYLKARLSSEKRGVYFILCALTVAAGMFSKQIAMTIPLMFLVVEIVLFGVRRKEIFRYTLYFLPAILVVPALYQFKIGLFSAEVVSGNSAGELMTWKTYALTQSHVILTYLKLFLVPIGQRLDYLFPVSYSLFEIKTFFSCLFLGLVLCMGFRWRRRYALVTFCVFWFFTTLLVESSIILIEHVIFEHRAYLPSVSLAILLSLGMHKVFQKKNYQVIACVLVMSVFIFLTIERNKVWQTDFTLWEDNLAKEPNKARPYISLGIAHIQKGDLDKALEYLNKAIELDARQFKAFHNRGLIYEKKQMYDLALADYTRALSLEGKKGLVYGNRGNLYQLMGNSEAAVKDFNKAIEMLPGYAEVYINRGIYFSERELYDAGLKDFNQALLLQPNSAEALNNRAVLFQKANRSKDALADLNQALGERINYAEAYYNRGNTHRDLKNYNEALEDYQQAIRLQPGYTAAYNNQGIVFGMVEQYEQALASFNKAVIFQPNFAEAYYNRALVYTRLKKFDLALEDVKTAQKLGRYIPASFLKQIQDAKTAFEVDFDDNL